MSDEPIYDDRPNYLEELRRGELELGMGIGRGRPRDEGYMREIIQERFGMRMERETSILER